MNDKPERRSLRRLLLPGGPRGGLGRGWSGLSDEHGAAAPPDPDDVARYGSPALGDPTAEAERFGPAEAADRRAEGVLVVGLGDESRADGGVGLHLMHFLSELDWPAGVTFCPADESVPARAGRYARVILLDALEGPEAPGSLYQADPESLLNDTVGGADAGMGLLAMLPAPVRRRLAIFGVQPADTRWGSPMSAEVLSALPRVLPYLRAYILRAAADVGQVN